MLPVFSNISQASSSAPFPSFSRIRNPLFQSLRVGTGFYANLLVFVFFVAVFFEEIRSIPPVLFYLDVRR